jgi:hypothetical protein
MRVPTLNGPSVGSVALPGYQRRAVRPDTSIMEAALELGGAARNVALAGAQTASFQQREEQKAAAEAAAVLEASKLIEFNDVAQRQLLGDRTGEGRINDAFSGSDTSQGFLASKGLKASELSAPTLKALMEERKRIAETIPDAQARQSFLLRSSESMLGFRRQVETHVGREFERARVGSAQAAEDQVIAMATSGSIDSDTFRLQMQQAEESIDAVSSSPEEAAARLAKLRANAGGAFVSSLLAQGRTDEASQYVDANREMLGTRYIGAKQDVTRANAGAERDRLIAEGAKLVDGSAEAVRSPDGYVTEEQLRKAVDLEEVPADVRGEVEQALNRRVRLEEGKLREDIGRERDNANRADVDGRPIPGETEEFLRKYDPDFLLARKARKAAEFRAWKASNGDARTKAAAARAQKALDAEFLARWNTELVNDPTASPDEFVTAFIAEKAKEGDEVTVSDLARAKAGESGAKAGKKAETVEGSAERAAAKRFEQTLGRAFKQKGKNLDQKLLNERVGRALQVYEQRLEAKGKPLDEAELAGIEAELLRDVTVTEPGRFWGTNETKKKAVDLVVPEAGAPEEKSVGGKAYVKRNGKWVLK